MKVNSFQEFLKCCKKFVSKMNKEDIDKKIQKAMLKAYIAGYITRNKYKIHLQDCHITELVS